MTSDRDADGNGEAGTDRGPPRPDGIVVAHGGGLDDAEVDQPGMRYEGTYRIENVESGKVLTVVERSGDPRGDVLQSSWDGTDDQTWTILANGDGTYRLRAEHSGNVLDVAGWSRDDGANVRQYYWKGDQTQCWHVEHLGDGECRLVNDYSGKVLAVEDGDDSDGAKVQQSNWSGGDAQRWRLQRI